MAVRNIRKKPLNAVEVISRRDDAIDHDNSDFEKYLETGDLAHLTFFEGKEPTIFLCNFELKGHVHEKIKNAQMSSLSSDGMPAITMGSWSFTLVKYVLKDIKNPDSVPEDEHFRFRSVKGQVVEELMAELERYGFVDDILLMYNKLTKLSGEEIKN